MMDRVERLEVCLLALEARLDSLERHRGHRIDRNGDTIGIGTVTFAPELQARMRLITVVGQSEINPS